MFTFLLSISISFDKILIWIALKKNFPECIAGKMGLNFKDIERINKLIWTKTVTSLKKLKPNLLR